MKVEGDILHSKETRARCEGGEADIGSLEGAKRKEKEKSWRQNVKKKKKKKKERKK